MAGTGGAGLAPTGYCIISTLYHPTQQAWAEDVVVSARPDSTSLQVLPALRAGSLPEMAWARELARFQRGEPVAPPYVVQLGRYALETILFFRRDTNDEPAGTANGGSLRARCRGNTFHLLLQAHASLDKNSHDSDILCLS